MGSHDITCMLACTSSRKVWPNKPEIKFSMFIEPWEPQPVTVTLSVRCLAAGTAGTLTFKVGILKNIKNIQPRTKRCEIADVMPSIVVQNVLFCH